MPASHHIQRPKAHTTAVVFASPHSGRAYPDALRQRSPLGEAALRSSEDALVDLLYDQAVELGAPMIRATAPRAWVDLNRAPDELDPAVIADLPPTRKSPRLASGLGVIPRVVAGGRAIYRGKITAAEAQARLDQVWHPYHSDLAALMFETQVHFGRAILVDCHSMPPEALVGLRAPRPQVVLGDRFGAAADARITAEIERAFTEAGFAVARNIPFAGAYIAAQYGAPHKGQHCVQIELDRSLYMEAPDNFTPGPKFAAMRARLRPVVARIIALGRPAQTSLAAE